MGTVQSDLAKTQAQIAARKQVLSPSDAPDQAAAIQRLKSVMSRQESYSKSLDTFTSRLNSEDSVLGSASDILIRVKEISIQANTDTMSAANRKALGTELQGLRNQLLSLANSQDSNGNYLFSGSRVGQAAFAEDGSGKVDYQGDQTRMNVVVGEQRSIPINRSGTDAFVRLVRSDTTTDPATTTAVGFFQSLDDLIKGVNGASGSDKDALALDRALMQRGTGEVGSLLQGVLMARANVGTDMRVVEQQASVVDETTLNLTSTLSNIEDLDYAAAITKLSKQMLALEATQSSFAKISQLSLFNYIK
jgi:flagellar hook-associated protein 3 FlgL